MTPSTDAGSIGPQGASVARASDAAPAASSGDASMGDPAHASGRGSRGLVALLSCQVSGCTFSLLGLREYHQRYRICEVHMMADHVVGRTGELQRFCQQCGRFQNLDLFDDSKRSCRERLARHNARRRRRMEAAGARAMEHSAQSGGQEEGGENGGSSAVAPPALTWSLLGPTPLHLEPQNSSATTSLATQPVGAAQLLAGSGSKPVAPQRMHSLQQLIQQLPSPSMRPSSAPSLGHVSAPSLPSSGSQSAAAANLLTLVQQDQGTAFPRATLALAPGPNDAGKATRPSWHDHATSGGGDQLSKMLPHGGLTTGWQQPFGAAPVPGSSPGVANMLGEGCTGPGPAMGYAAAREFLTMSQPSVRPRHETRPFSWPESQGQTLPIQLSVGGTSITPLFRSLISDEGSHPTTCNTSAAAAPAGQPPAMLAGQGMELDRLAMLSAQQRQQQQLSLFPGPGTLLRPQLSSPGGLVLQPESETRVLGENQTLESIWEGLLLEQQDTSNDY